MSLNSATSVAVLDVEGSLARFGGDRALFGEMTSLLMEDAPSLFADLQNAVRAGDAGTIERRAHALRGLLANCGGVRASQVAQRLEDIGRTGMLDSARTLIECLESELSSLSAAIQAYRP